MLDDPPSCIRGGCNGRWLARTRFPMNDTAPAAPAKDAVIWGVTAKGRSFRPSDWAERLAGLTSAFGFERKLAYSPLVRPMTVRGTKAVVIDCKLADLEPRLYQFLLNFARDNELVVAFVPEAMANAHSLEPPAAPSARHEPREPV
jgi:hypothetical protein